MFSVVCNINTSTGDRITLLNNSRETLISARNKALNFILRNGSIGIYTIYEIKDNEKHTHETKEIRRIADDIILRRKTDYAFD